MANINKIKLSGTTYTIQDENATKTVELTQAQYDALAVKDPNTFYIITDAEAVDLANYYTKSETDDLLDTKLDVSAYTPTDLSNYYTKSETSGATQISTALNAKADTLVSGTNIKTINNESILGSGNIEIQGGGDVTVDPSLDSGSTNPVANSAITQELRNVAHFGGVANDGYLTGVTFGQEGEYPSGKLTLSLSKTRVKSNGLSNTSTNTAQWLYVSSINGKRCFSTSSSNVEMFNLVETSAITTSMSSASTDSQVPSAKAVYDQFGGLKLVKLSQAEYDALTTKDSNTLYVIV